MTIRDQLAELNALRVRYVVIGGQAGVMRQAVDFSKDLDILIPDDRPNAELVRTCVRSMTSVEVDVDTILGRDFQQYIHPSTGAELDIHLELIAIPSYDAGLRNASVVDYLGVDVTCLELPALYASKRTDRPKDAVHRLAIEDRLRGMLVAGRAAPDEVLLACCLDASVTLLPSVSERLLELARTTAQPQLQIRIVAHAPELNAGLLSNPALHATTKSLLALPDETRNKIVRAPARLAALLAKTPILLPPEGFIVRAPGRVTRR